jgi:hypothetical protein
VRGRSVERETVGIAGLASLIDGSVTAGRSLAVVVAFVGVDAVAVVALFSGVPMAVAANRAVVATVVPVVPGRRSRWIARLIRVYERVAAHRYRAVVPAAVGIDTVAVVARFSCVLVTVAADRAAGATI